MPEILGNWYVAWGKGKKYPFALNCSSVILCRISGGHSAKQFRIELLEIYLYFSKDNFSFVI